MYRRFEEWAEDLSRGKYAILVGILSMLVALVIGRIYPEITLYDAVITGFSMMAVYYFFYPVLNE